MENDNTRVGHSDRLIDGRIRDYQQQIIDRMSNPPRVYAGVDWAAILEPATSEVARRMAQSFELTGDEWRRAFGGTPVGRDIAEELRQDIRGYGVQDNGAYDVVGREPTHVNSLQRQEENDTRFNTMYYETVYNFMQSGRQDNIALLLDRENFERNNIGNALFKFARDMGVYTEVSYISRQSVRVVLMKG